MMRRKHKNRLTAFTGASVISQSRRLKFSIVPLIFLLFLYIQLSAAKHWNFTQASKIIDFIEQKLEQKPSQRDLAGLLYNVKRHLVEFERTSVRNTNSTLKPVLRKDDKATSREFINRKKTKLAKGREGVHIPTFKGQKIIQINDDVEGRLGKWTVLKAMEKLLDTIPSKVSDAERICRPGPLHASRSTDKSTERKCLILGDSISIGYHDYVAEMLDGDCVVHHAPWAGDGGSLDTRYILQCLPMLLSSSVYEPVHYDAIIFNAGLHDIDCCDFPKEYVPLKKYAENLKKIKKTLLNTGAMVAFATSTPVPFSKEMNKRLRQYNKAAIKVMTDDEPISVINLYKRVLKACDGVSLRKCDKFQQQPNLHLTGAGYMSLADEVSNGFTRLLKKARERKHRLKDSKTANALRDSKYCLSQAYNKKQDINGITGCPANTTCCLNEFSHSFVGCCMQEDAMDCGDSWHCCPKGTVCDPSCSMKQCSCRKAPWESKGSRTTFSILMKSLNVFWKNIIEKYRS